MGLYCFSGLYSNRYGMSRGRNNKAGSGYRPEQHSNTICNKSSLIKNGSISSNLSFPLQLHLNFHPLSNCHCIKKKKRDICHLRKRSQRLRSNDRGDPVRLKRVRKSQRFDDSYTLFQAESFQPSEVVCPNYVCPRRFPIIQLHCHRHPSPSPLHLYWTLI